MTSAPHNYEHEQVLWDTFADGAWKDPSNSDPVLRWTQYTDHPADPGMEILGNPATALEIGSGTGTGRAAAYLAKQGVKVTAVDLSPIAVANSSERYGPSASSSCRAAAFNEAAAAASVPGLCSDEAP
ncbi:hypothetical protein GCM10010425_49900 [Streptomyces spororaveus]|uniref:Methyltransferase type 11 domain-containing protein n=1 Tax=Streptomyces spororaveus TaxID=284039 RepID=A0ABQ3T2H5_9ACTN|nr:class I SAM-dependent methyltransferase [Streptomyces spororaveus]GHI74584.1 hypothetical protein Sspor_01450 [Streptomyces spororaveus]